MHFSARINRGGDGEEKIGMQVKVVSPPLIANTNSRSDTLQHRLGSF